MKASIKGKLKKLKVMFFDADGVFFDGQEYRFILPEGDVIVGKSRSYPDGQGLSFLRELGIRIVFVSGEGEPLQSIIEKLNSIPSAKSRRWKPVEIFTKKNARGEKVATILAWLKDNKFPLGIVGYMGDDVNDREPMEIIKKGGGIIICPANAMRVVKPLADIVTKKSGGFGAIREFSEMVLDARGVDESTLPPA